MPQFFIITCFEKKHVKTYTKSQDEIDIPVQKIKLVSSPCYYSSWKDNWPTNNSLDGLLLQPWRQENSTQDSLKRYHEGWFLFFFVFRGMCASESWGTKKLVSALQKMSIATGKHLNVVFLLDFLKIHVHSAALHILPALKFQRLYLKCTFKTSNTHSWNIPCW